MNKKIYYFYVKSPYLIHEGIVTDMIYSQGTVKEKELISLMITMDSGFHFKKEYSIELPVSCDHDDPDILFHFEDGDIQMILAFDKEKLKKEYKKCRMKMYEELIKRISELDESEKGISELDKPEELHK